MSLYSFLFFSSICYAGVWVILADAALFFIDIVICFTILLLIVSISVEIVVHIAGITWLALSSAKRRYTCIGLQYHGFLYCQFFSTRSLCDLLMLPPQSCPISLVRSFSAAFSAGVEFWMKNVSPKHCARHVKCWRAKFKVSNPSV